MRKTGTINRDEGFGRLLRPALLSAAIMLAIAPHPIAAEPNEADEDQRGPERQ